jgi:hypothetical protein
MTLLLFSKMFDVLNFSDSAWLKLFIMQKAANTPTIFPIYFKLK